MADDVTTLNIKGLENLIKALKARPMMVRVGVLGENAMRNDGQDGPSNATIGAWHEFGTSRTPVRSFLRMPLTVFLDKEMKKSGLLTKETLAQVIKEKSLLPWLKKVAVVAEGVVAKAFDTGGFGTWPPSDFSKKHNHQTLVESQQLRNSITSDIKEVG